MTDLRGHCACGAVTWHHSGDLIAHVACHCESCRRATSSAFAAFVGTLAKNVTWTGEINHYQSSRDAKRGFCPTCGTRLYFQSNNWPDQLHLHVGTLENPHTYTPDKHVVLEEQVDWITLADTIEKSQTFHFTPKAAPND